MLPVHHKCMEADTSDDLWVSILTIVQGEKEEVDRKLVYVAFHNGRTLISNDKRHIINGRDGLLQSARSMLPQGGDIMTSKEAHEAMP